MAKVLYVDDDVANLTVFEATCAGELDVLTCGSGAEALEILAKHEIAVLLADQRMPGMTGVELAERAKELYPNTIRILITAYSDIRDAIDAINRGEVRSYLRKPWDPDVLIATLRDAVDHYETRRKIEELERRMLETERLYALGVVASGLAHELRNPLAVLSGSNDLIALRLEELAGRPLGDPWTSDDGERVVDMGEHVELSQAAVDQMLEICKGVELGNRRRDREHDTDLAEVVQLTIKSAYGTIKHHAQVSSQIQEPLPRVRGNRNQLGQVVLNLLVNAMQAFAEAGDDNRVDVRLRREGEVLHLEVEDNGPGIPAETLERIFHPFFTTKTNGGTGLGLAISRKIVEEIGGAIEADSVVGEGTCFTVTLPISHRGGANGPG